jgi:hypothetical protein
MSFLLRQALHTHLSRHVPLDEPIDLLNVAFENPRKIQMQAGGNMLNRKKMNISNQSVETNYMVPDRMTGLQEREELRRLCPGRIWNFVRAISCMPNFC